MAEPTYHHVGILVPEMGAAIAWFSDVLGIKFHAPQRMTTHGRIDPAEFGDDEQHEGTSHLAWAQEGPPYYELVEAKGTGLHSLERHGAGLHHVGLFVPDVDAVLARLAPAGGLTEGRIVGPDGRTMVCWTQRSAATGVMVEYMDERMRAGIQRWIDTGQPPQIASIVSPP